MVSTTNPDSLHPDQAASAADATPTDDDLLALIPDMELLESEANDALAAHSAMAAAASGTGRPAAAAPKLSDPLAPPPARVAAAKTPVRDDPYADLMPELEPFDEGKAPAVPARSSARPPVVPASKPAAPIPAVPAPRAAAPAPAAAPRPASPPPPAAPRSAPPKAAAPARSASPAPASTKKPPSPDAVVVPPVMDKEFIARNRIVELYVSGRLPVRAATGFEKFCQENPQMLDEIGLPERVHAGLRLLESAGKPEPWQEKPKRFWERPIVPAVLSALVLILGVALLVLNGQLSDQSRKIGKLQKLVTEQPIDATASTATVDIQPTHAGPNQGAATVIGGTTAQLVNLKIDESHSDFRAFRVTIDRVNQGKVAVLNNLIKDSNGALNFSLNTSALGADLYQLTIEGLDWRGDPQPESWASINIKH